jgi:DNA-3-methyladenine glycosylase
MGYDDRHRTTDKTSDAFHMFGGGDVGLRHASHGSARPDYRAIREMTPPERLGREFFALPAVRLAPRLLGQRLVRILPSGERLVGVIVETEAYVGVRDRASHSFAGRRTARNEMMYAKPGTAYVYFTYGMHFCFNIVCAREGDPQAVLIRALEPVQGMEAMRAARAAGRRRLLSDADLCSGPGKLCQAMRIDRHQNGLDLCESKDMWLEAGHLPKPSFIRRTARIGVDGAGEWAERPLRWLVGGNGHVSPGRPSVALSGRRPRP